MKLCLARSSPLRTFRGRDTSLARGDGCICRLITKHKPYLCERKKMVQKEPIAGFKKILNQTELHQGTRTQSL